MTFRALMAIETVPWEAVSSVQSHTDALVSHVGIPKPLLSGSTGERAEVRTTSDCAAKGADMLKIN